MLRCRCNVPATHQALERRGGTLLASLCQVLHARRLEVAPSVGREAEHPRGGAPGHGARHAASVAAATHGGTRGSAGASKQVRHLHRARRPTQRAEPTRRAAPDGARVYRPHRVLAPAEEHGRRFVDRLETLETLWQAMQEHFPPNARHGNDTLNPGIIVTWSVAEDAGRRTAQPVAVSFLPEILDTMLGDSARTADIARRAAHSVELRMRDYRDEDTGPAYRIAVDSHALDRR